MRSRLLFVVATLIAFLGFAAVWLSPLLPVAGTPPEAFENISCSQCRRCELMLAWGSHALRTTRCMLPRITCPLPWTFAFSRTRSRARARCRSTVWKNDPRPQHLPDRDVRAGGRRHGRSSA
jgi:hypothetical protein